ncbi:MAG TPA: hypothetical protein VJQ25_00100 [Nitrospira sp.]|nr:hypothetical protein [Nitrospira sp.]
MKRLTLRRVALATLAFLVLWLAMIFVSERFLTYQGTGMYRAGNLIGAFFGLCFLVSLITLFIMGGKWFLVEGQKRAAERQRQGR